MTDEALLSDAARSRRGHDGRLARPHTGRRIVGMAPERALPYGGSFSSVDDYVEALLAFASNNDVFQTLCGGVHVV